MSSIVSLNNSLHRQLKNGAQYNKYFSNVSCKSQFLGKGKTSFGLQQMKQMVLKYQHQTKKIAKVLEKNTIPATVLNIKKFLYDHLQYSADGWDQNLRSPNCSWQTRKKGIDCKSYSLFAMSILFNLKIPNISFRKITQPSSPDKWSHVYVVVKHNNQELIIDATVPYNYEVAKVKQEDLPMEKDLPYYGMNAMQSTVVNRKTYKIATALENLQDFLDDLEAKGVSRQTTDAIWNEIKGYLSKGKEPKIKLTTDYIIVENKQFDFSSGLNGFFDDLVGIGTNAATGNIGGAVSGLFSSIFSGKDANKHATQRIVIPMGNHIKQKISSANKNTIHKVVTDLDKHLNAYINHERKVNSKYSKVALPQLQEMLKELRSKYAYLKPVSRSGGSGSFKDFWSGGTKTLVHAGTFNYNEYQPATALNYDPLTQLNINTTTNSNPVSTNNGLDWNNAINQGFNLLNNNNQNNGYQVNTNQNGLPSNVNYQNAQGGNASNIKEEGMSTATVVGLSLAGLLVVGIAAKKMNII